MFHLRKISGHVTPSTSRHQRLARARPGPPSLTCIQDCMIQLAKRQRFGPLDLDSSVQPDHRLSDCICLGSGTRMLSRGSTC